MVLIQHSTRAAGALIALAGAASAQATQHHLFTVEGEALLDQLGAAVAPAGDVDLDGRCDFLVGAPASIHRGPGYAAVYSGRDGLELLHLAPGLPAGPTSSRFGDAVAGLADLDQDGWPELAVGAPRADLAGMDSGSVYVFSGRDGALLHRFDGLGAGHRFGAVVAAAGDVDGDGRGDLAVGAPGGGYARVLSGEWIGSTSQGAPPATPQVLLALAGAPGLGAALAGVGDVDRDGFDDVAVAAPGTADAGAVHVLSGATGGALAVLGGNAPGDLFGSALAAAGDLDGDLHPDVLVGAPGHDGAGPGAGLVRVVSGEWIAATAAGTTPQTPYALREHFGPEAGDGLGASVSGGRDLDLDGVPDVVAGAVDGASLAPTPFARAWSGASGGLLFTVTATDAGDRTGWSAALSPDMNADGHADLLVGSPRSGALGAGLARALSGKRLLLAADSTVIELGAGGAMHMTLDAPPSLAGQFYVMLGTASGVAPGIPTPVGLLPLNFDSYTIYVLNKSPELKSFQGFLNAGGDGVASVDLPPGTTPAIVGFELDYAYAVLNVLHPWVPTTAVSNSVPLRFELDDCAAPGGVGDCNGNGVLDACDIADGTSYDCDGNGVPDECDLATGTLSDTDLDGIPDVCTSVVFVDADATGANNGASWSNAFTDLRLALAAAPDFAQIWVAEGTYRPWMSAGNRAASFELRDTVGVYGGFAGTEFALSQRDPDAHPTVLSGDVLQDDASGGTQLDNSYNVVEAGELAGPTAVLDGFLVRAGFANETGACDVYEVYFQSCIGAGLLSLGSPTIRNCRFVDNFGGHQGGGAWVLGEPTFVRCLFEQNGAFEGAGAFVDLASEALFVDCVFRGNESLYGGGAYVLGNVGDLTRFVGCVFDGNLAAERGGGLHVEYATVDVVNCTFANNVSFAGPGGLTLGPLATVEVQNSILWGNTGADGVFEDQLSGGAASAAYSCIQGFAGQVPGPGNHAFDPQFANAKGPNNVAGDADDDLRPLPGSPSVDSGDTTLLPADLVDLDQDGDTLETWPTDLDGGPRVADVPSKPDTGVPGPGGHVVDRGAYEG